LVTAPGSTVNKTVHDVDTPLFVIVIGSEIFPLKIGSGVIMRNPSMILAAATPLTEVGTPLARTITLVGKLFGNGIVTDTAPTTRATIVEGLGVPVGVPVGVGVDVGDGLLLGAGSMMKLIVKVLVVPKSSVTATREVKPPANDGVPLIVALEVPDVKAIPVGNELAAQLE
jgi:hypothetical protein